MVLLGQKKQDNPPALAHDGCACAPSPGGRAKITWPYLAVLFFSIFQFYIVNVGQLYFPLYLFACYFLVFQVTWSRLRRSLCAKWLVTLYAVQLISWAWAVDYVLATREIVYNLPFLVIFLYCFQNIQTAPERIWRAVRIYCVFALVQSAMVVVMHFLPQSANAFYGSPIMHLFTNPNALTEFTTTERHIATDGEIVKSGGFMINSNRAGTLAGMLFYLSILSFRGCRRLIAWPVIGGHLLAILFCGSKASLGLLVLLPVGLLYPLAAPTKEKTIMRFAMVAMLGLLFLGVLSGVRSNSTASAYAAGTANTWSSRVEIWKYAGREFLKSPLLGQGYGGWNFTIFEVKGAGIGLDVRSSLPPHNAFIMLWSQSGLIAALLGIMVWFLIYQRILGLRKIDKGMFLCLMGGFTVFVVQSLGENGGLFGDNYMLTPAASIAGIAAGAIAKATETKEEKPWKILS